MPDRVIRDELLDSDRWLSLPSDTDRLCYVGLLLRCDDFGNLEGGDRRLARFLSTFTAIRSDGNATVTLAHLVDADLIRGYQVDGRQFWHLPRLRTHRSYLVRKVPPSPWCNADEILGKTARISKQGLAKNLAATSPQSVSDVSLGVGVGVGVVKKKTTHASRAAAPSAPAGVSEEVWNDFMRVRRAHRAPITSTALRGIEREALKAKLTLEGAITIAVERGWRSFKAEWVLMPAFGGKGAPSIASEHKPWHQTASGIKAKARELGIEEGDDWLAFRAKVYERAGVQA